MIKINEKTEVALKSAILRYLRENVIFEGSPNNVVNKQLEYAVDLYDLLVMHLLGTDNNNFEVTNI